MVYLESNGVGLWLWWRGWWGHPPLWTKRWVWVLNLSPHIKPPSSQVFTSNPRGTNSPTWKCPGGSGDNGTRVQLEGNIPNLNHIVPQITRRAFILSSYPHLCAPYAMDSVLKFRTIHITCTNWRCLGPFLRKGRKLTIFTCYLQKYSTFHSKCTVIICGGSMLLLVSPMGLSGRVVEMGGWG